VSIEIRNIGPIGYASVGLRPLTVFIGKNSTGKSYAAELIYSILSAEPELSNYFYPYTEEYSTLETALKPLQKIRSKEERIARIVESIKAQAEASLRNQIQSNIETVMGSEKRIRRFGTSEFSIMYKGPTFEFSKTHKQAQASMMPRNLIPVQRLVKKAYRTRFPYLGRYELSYRFQRISSRHGRVYYLPAERAGFMKLSRSLLASFAVRRLMPRAVPLVDRRRREALTQLVKGEVVIPPLLNDLLDVMLLGRERPFFEQDLDALQTVIGGEIFEKPEALGIYFRFGRGKVVQIEEASSGVAEIAPLYLMVHKRLAPGDLLIFEEPEAHLHPRAQVALARFFARLVRKHVRLLITTHSTLLPIALVHLVAMSRIPSDKRVGLGYNQGEYLKSRELALFHFRDSENGSTTEPIPFEPSGSLEELPGMDSVVDDLFGEEAKLIEQSVLTHKQQP
jgi:predicted ATPase